MGDNEHDDTRTAETLFVDDEHNDSDNDTEDGFKSIPPAEKALYVLGVCRNRQTVDGNKFARFIRSSQRPGI